MGLSLPPSVITDILGSLGMVVLACISLRYTFLLTRREPENFLWGFLDYFCLALVAFSISRCAGHMVKQILLIFDKNDIWRIISPYSGGLNTLLMISVAAVIIYYHKGVEGYRAIEQKAKSLKVANAKLEEASSMMQQMNMHLEEMVDSRTQDLALSEKKFRSFFHNSKDMVFLCDRDGLIVDMNQAGLEILDYEPEEELNLFLGQLFTNKNDLDHFDNALQNQKFIEDFEVKLTKKDAVSSIYVLLSATGIFLDTGEFAGCEVIAKDLTRLKAMTAQMINTEKMASVGQIAAGVAHEINTPLGIILGYSQLMKEDFPKESEEYENLVVVERQSHACKKIVADLLKFSRQTESTSSEVNINNILEDVLSLTERNLHLDHIHIVRQFSENVPEVTGDGEKLRQVFINLINNGQHAMEDHGGILTVLTRYVEDEKMVVASIVDTGTGIDSTHRDKIFDPFFTTKSVGKGTGLGLSVSYGIIEDHRGTIVVESPQCVNKSSLHPGTAMHIKLPISELSYKKQLGHGENG